MGSKGKAPGHGIPPEAGGILSDDKKIETGKTNSNKS